LIEIPRKIKIKIKKQLKPSSFSDLKMARLEIFLMGGFL